MNQADKEKYFNLGASAMQGKIVATLMVRGHVAVAPTILNVSLPDFREPEVTTFDLGLGNPPL